MIVYSSCGSRATPSWFTPTMKNLQDKMIRGHITHHNILVEKCV
uniref:Uncharacterized protein n=1 Tax=Arundo donax TaxID=35708 RepID=A0A0A8ZTZ8_ARUDO